MNKYKKIRKLCFASIITILSLYSCVSTKNIREENKTVPNEYQNQSADTTNTVSVKWKDFFSDPNLVALIDAALINNQELNIMLQHVDMVKNEIKAKKGEYLPFVGIYAGAEVEKVGEFTRNGAVEKTLNIREEEEFPEPLANYSVGLSASWELDIWGKLRKGKKAAVLEYLASVEGKNFMVTQLVSEITSSYYELMALDNQLAIIEQNLEIQQNALKMVKLQKEAARTTQLAVSRFEAEVFKNKSNKFEIQQKIVETENFINFLVGRYPQPVTRSSENFITKKVDSINAGIPSQLLENRPDIRKAELELSVSKLNVSIAKANFYPSIGIKAGVGLEAFKPKFLTSTPESLLYSLVGDVVSPLINRNAIKAEYKNANDRQLQAVFEYEKTILNAYIEVANQLSSLQNLKESYSLKEKQVQALTESIDLSIRLFKSARAEYTEVLLTQREALDSKIEIIETKRDQLLANVKLYQALGGGWN
ncbi:efflux transporter, outer membrane factor (OMF) lipoprotein, NodT family [Flaviramulus basaltis]|uniref:Efflux transporter, outer membrane factor (OMF) lipoprotein, NodT family n=1 Tax=Flaviramulus basaltis TaxID=369401 RepID=A0A1K2IF03_9FLAO|nr:TolC family protein [Flaviramulus basaltis]SFZ90291.1 efflux transporter, outer membrane factor (OMF) lipoprotein, NodT family [Flaviramulus basaltis]